MGNGPEMASAATARGDEERNADLEFIELGKPPQCPLINRFNRACREKMLNLNPFF